MRLHDILRAHVLHITASFHICIQNREEARDKWKANRPAGDRKNRMGVCKVSARTSRWEWGKLVYFPGKQTIARYLLKHALSFSPALGAFGTGPASLCIHLRPDPRSHLEMYVLVSTWIFWRKVLWTVNLRCTVIDVTIQLFTFE